MARPLRMERAGSDKRGISSMWRRRSGKEYRLVLGSMCRRSWFWAAVSFWRRSVARWGGVASGTTATPGTEAAAELERGADGSRRVVRREMGSAPGSARPLGAGVGIVFGPPDLRAASGRVGIRSEEHTSEVK